MDKLQKNQTDSSVRSSSNARPQGAEKVNTKKIEGRKIDINFVGEQESLSLPPLPATSDVDSDDMEVDGDPDFPGLPVGLKHSQYKPGGKFVGSVLPGSDENDNAGNKKIRKTKAQEKADRKAGKNLKRITKNVSKVGISEDIISPVDKDMGSGETDARLSDLNKKRKVSDNDKNNPSVLKRSKKSAKVEKQEPERGNVKKLKQTGEELVESGARRAGLIDEEEASKLIVVFKPKGKSMTVDQPTFIQALISNATTNKSKITQVVCERNDMGYLVEVSDLAQRELLIGCEISVSDRRHTKHKNLSLDIYVGSRSVRGCSAFIVEKLSFLPVKSIFEAIRSGYGTDNLFKLFRASSFGLPIDTYVFIFTNAAIFAKDGFSFPGAKSTSSKSSGRKGDGEFFASVVPIIGSNCPVCPETTHEDLSSCPALNEVREEVAQRDRQCMTEAYQALKFLAVNVNGVSSSSRRPVLTRLIAYITARELAAVFLFDSGINSEYAADLSESWSNRGLLVIGQTGPDNGQGVLIIINANIVQIDGTRSEMIDLNNNWESLTGRIMIIKLIKENLKVTVGAIYQPPRMNQRREFTQKLMEMQILDDRRCDILVGDWNMTLLNIDSSSMIAPHQIDLEDHQQVLNKFMREGQLAIDGWRLRYPESRLYTHRNNTNYNGELARTRIDRFYVREDWMPYTENWTIGSENGYTDHREIEMSLTKATVKRGKGRWRAPLALLEDRNIRNKLLEVFLDKTRSEGTPRNIIEGWAEAKHSMAKVFKNEKRKIQNAVHSRRRTLLRRVQDDGSIEDELRAEWIELEGLDADDRKNFCYEWFQRNYVENGETDKSLFEKVKKMQTSRGFISSLQKENGEIADEPEGILEEVDLFYSRLYSSQGHNQAATNEITTHIERNISEAQKVNLTRPISATDIDLALKKANMSRSPGWDGLPTEVYKMLISENAEAVKERILKFFQALWKMRSGLPAWFLNGCLVILYKKGDPQNLKNYRPLTIMGSDYRLYTLILAHRLTGAASEVIEDQQCAYLPGRRIGDNIKLVQTLIDVFDEHQEEGLGILFLDQEKAFDKMEHKYLFKVLSRFGIPRKFIEQVRKLYHGATTTPIINGFKGRDYRVERSVRQGDALSCPLYILGIEPLSLAIKASPEIMGVRSDITGLITKLAQYGDDTTLFFRTKEEFVAISSVLDLFSRASGGTYNWPKTKMLLLGTLEGEDDFDTPIEIIPRRSAITHLGIPVGVEITEIIDQFWGSMIEKMVSSGDKWIAMHQPLKVRTRLAKMMILSIPRYAISFLYIKKEQQKKMQSAVNRLIWDGKSTHHISHERSLLPFHRGGLNNQDIGIIVQASVIMMIARMDKYPRLPWVAWAAELMRSKSRSSTLRLNKISTPWKQKLNAKTQNMVGNPSVKHLWDIWIKLIPLELGINLNGLGFIEPVSTEDILNTNFWYFPDIFTLGPSRQVGVRFWGSRAWDGMAAGLDGNNCSVIGDIWDPATGNPRDLGLVGRDKRKVDEAINRFIIALPPSWRAGLDEFSLIEHNGWRDRPAFQHCVMRRTLQNGDIEQRELNRLFYKWVYDGLIAVKTSGIQDQLNDRIEGIVLEMTGRLRRIVRASQIWRAVDRPERVPKANDLLQKLLWGSLRTGKKLQFLTEDKHLCPVDGEDQDLNHIFIDCSVARAVWEEFSRILINLNHPRGFALPENMNQLVGFFALEPTQWGGLDASRWHILYSETVWQVWKCYLNNSFRREPFSAEAVVGIFRKSIIHRILIARTTVMLPRNRDRREDLRRNFSGIWRQDPLTLLSAGRTVALGGRYGMTIASNIGDPGVARLNLANAEEFSDAMDIDEGADEWNDTDEELNEEIDAMSIN